MRIVCLGWGSLIWDPKCLKVDPKWSSDGPFLPLEFARISNDDRVTLVLLEGATPVQCLWTNMFLDDLLAARYDLMKREMRSEDQRNLDKIGFWTRTSNSGSLGVSQIGQWAVPKMDIDAVIWTALLPKGFCDRYCESLSDKVVEHLGSLLPPKREKAEEYVRRAPTQVRTNVRRAIEHELGWRPEDRIG
jgi:hypothetical protein